MYDRTFPFLFVRALEPYCFKGLARGLTHLTGISGEVKTFADMELRLDQISEQARKFPQACKYEL